MTRRTVPAHPAVRHLAVALVPGLALALLVAVAPVGRAPHPVELGTTPVAKKATGYTPVTRATFNRPLGVGTKAQQRAIFTTVNRTIDAVPRGSVIRIAVFSFSEKATADALLRAKARGVRVRLIFDDHAIYAQEARLRRALGKNPHAKSFVIYCSHACRSTGGDMHDKIFMFSTAGRAHAVSMVGSNNMTSYNAQHQWADVYTIANDRRLYTTYTRLFGHMKLAKPLASTYYQVDDGKYQAQFFPYLKVPQAEDPVMVTLSKIVCAGAAPGTGVAGMTLVRISQHAWFGPRGTYIANRVAALRQQGCVVQVIPGITMGATVRSVLTKAGVELATTRHKGARTHQKVLQISGNFDGNPAAEVVFTGSENYSDRALTNDDNILRIEDPAAYAQYAKNFRFIWNHG